MRPFERTVAHMPMLVRPPPLPNLERLHVRLLVSSRVKDMETQEQASQKDCSTGAPKEHSIKSLFLLYCFSLRKPLSSNNEKMKWGPEKSYRWTFSDLGRGNQSSSNFRVKLRVIWTLRWPMEAMVLFSQCWKPRPDCNHARPVPCTILARISSCSWRKTGFPFWAGP